jgi:hypothetical protein
MYQHHFCSDCVTSQDSLGRTTIHESCAGCIAVEGHDRGLHAERPRPNVCWRCDLEALDVFELGDRLGPVAAPEP